MDRLAQPLFAIRLLAALSLVAAGIHAWVVPEHVEEYWLFGAFFVVVTLFQAAWAAAVLRRPTARVLGAGVAVSAAILAVWVLSRTAGLPVGPEHWEAESVAALDVVAGIAELGIVAFALAVLAAGRSADRHSVTTPIPTREPGVTSGSEAA